MTPPDPPHRRDEAAVPTTVLVGSAAELRLQELGLRVDAVRRPLESGYSHAADCTANDPRGTAGYLVWAKGTGDLRDRLAALGWQAMREENFETTIHPGLTHQIALSAGTSQTGVSTGPPPRTLRPRGTMTSRAVRRNRPPTLDQGTGVFSAPGVQGPPEPTTDPLTYFLLHYFNEESEEMQSELSLPDDMEGKHITHWSERIILPAFPFDDGIAIPIDPDEDIDVQVRRRAS